MNKLTAEKCGEMFIQLFTEKRQYGITLKEDLYMQALEIAFPILEQQERGEDSEDIFIVMRKPGCMPVIKRPVGDLEDYLGQLYNMNEGATCDVVTYRYSGVSGQWVNDGRELLKTAEMSRGQPTNQNGAEV